MLVVIALGGNALLRRGEDPDAGVQRRHVRDAVEAIAAIAADCDLVVTHGNGPQVGFLALQAEAYGGAEPYPLDVLGAQTEGQIGYLIEQELTNALGGRRVATLLTQVLVAGDDPAFGNPTKPIGPVFDRDRGARLAAERGWTMAPDREGLRRVVPSPEPQRILELATIQLLVDAGVVVVCAGGGGIPVEAADDGLLSGVEAVIDKDLATELLARELGADALLLLTDVAAVEADWGKPEARPIREISAAELRELDLAAGTMGPKAEAACRFAERTGRPAAIGALEDAAAILAGEAGTRITAGRGRAP